jgi:DNA-binding transcriptional regulator YiaG
MNAFAEQITPLVTRHGRRGVHIAATAIGVSKPTIRAWMAGKTCPSNAEQLGALQLLVRIAPLETKETK